MKHLTCIILCCIALLLAAVASFADTPIFIEFVTPTPVSACACQPVDIEVKAQDYDSTTSGVGYDDLVFIVYPYPSGWTATAAPTQDEDGWWHQTFRQTFDTAGEEEYTFRAIDLDIFHGEDDLLHPIVSTEVVIQDHYDTAWDIVCYISPLPNGGGYAPDAEVSCSASAVDEDLWNCGLQSVDLTCHWSATLGSFPYGDTGNNVVWRAPSRGSCTITVTADDEGDEPGYCGTQDDDQVSASVDVTVGITHVKPESEGGNDAEDGWSWSHAKATIQEGVNTASATGKEVWVAEGEYCENILITTGGLALYGGFNGAERRRQDRNYAIHETIIHGFGDSVITVSHASSPVGIDGFTLTGGAGTFCDEPVSGYCGGGICCDSSSAVIINNQIVDNLVDNHFYYAGYGAGVFALNCSNLIIANNVVAGNGFVDWSGYEAVGLVNCSGQVVGNTIAMNANIFGICYDSPITLANNIIAFNLGGTDNTGVGAHTNTKNCVYGNTYDDYIGTPGIGDLNTDPLLVNPSGGDYHLSSTSPCQDAGNAAYTFGDFDMDMDLRVEDLTVDIGADELSACGRVNLTITAPGTTCIPDFAEFIVHVSLNGAPVSGYHVTFTLIDGTIESIVTGTVTSATTGYGDTDASGNISVFVSRSTPGQATLTAHVEEPCGPPVERTAMADFDYRPCDIVFVVDVSGSMVNHEASYPGNASIQSFAHDIASQVPNVRFGAVMFNTDTFLRSINQFAGVDSFCAWVGTFAGTGGTSAQVQGLNAAALDLETHSTPYARRFIAYVTDADIGTGDMQDRLELVQQIDEVTQANGGGVYISLWEASQGALYQHYSQNFTGDPLYPTLAVNGGFDPTGYPSSYPADQRYLFANLRARILQGQ